MVDSVSGLICQLIKLMIPLCSIQIQTINITTNIRSLVLILEQDLEIEVKLVNRDLMLPSMGLQHSCEETLGEEEARQPEDRWLVIGDPLIEEIHSSHQVFNIGQKGFVGRVASGQPIHRHLVLQQLTHCYVQLVGHHCFPFQSRNKVSQRFSYDC